MIPFFFAWAIGEGIIVARWAKAGAPPTPGALAKPAALFIALAVIAQEPRARPAATAFAYAVVLAIGIKIIGNSPTVETGWPPQDIDNPNVILPPGAGAAPATA